MRTDLLALGAQGLLFSLAVPVLLYGEGYWVHVPETRRRFRVLGTAMVLASSGALGASTWRGFLLWAEVALLAGAGLVALGDRRRAGLFLLVQVLGASLILLAAAGAEGGTSPPLGPLESPWQGLLLLGLGIKLALPPVHGWLPEVQGRADPPVGALLTGAAETLGVYGFLRALGPPIPTLEILGALGGGLILLGGWGVLRSGEVRRLLAHSTLVQLGFLVLAGSLGADPRALLVFAAAHGQYKVLLFLGAGELRRWRGHPFLEGEGVLPGSLAALLGVPLLLSAGLPGGAPWAAKGEVLLSLLPGPIPWGAWGGGMAGLFAAAGAVRLGLVLMRRGEPTAPRGGEGFRLVALGLLLLGAAGLSLGLLFTSSGTRELSGEALGGFAVLLLGGWILVRLGPSPIRRRSSGDRGLGWRGNLFRGGKRVASNLRGFHTGDLCRYLTCLGLALAGLLAVL